MAQSTLVFISLVLAISVHDTLGNNLNCKDLDVGACACAVESSGKLCSNACYHSCPNIVDLLFNLAAGEGVYFPKLCEARKYNTRREMIENLDIPRSSTTVIMPSDAPISESPSELDATQFLQLSNSSSVSLIDSPVGPPFADGLGFDFDWNPVPRPL